MNLKRNGDYFAIHHVLLKHVTAGRIKGWIEVAGRRGRRRKKLLDDTQEKTGHWILKEEVLDRTLWKRQWAFRNVG
jgi:hypothetical protein